MARAWTDRGLLSLEAEAFEEQDEDQEMVVAENEAAQAHRASPSLSLSPALAPPLSLPLFIPNIWDSLSLSLFPPSPSRAARRRVGVTDSETAPSTPLSPPLSPSLSSIRHHSITSTETASGREPGAGMMRGLEGRAEALAGTFKAQDVANTLWAYATMRQLRSFIIPRTPPRFEISTSTKTFFFLR